MSDGSWRFTDATAPPNEREWRAEPALGGGVTIIAMDDQGALFDKVTLKRFGAFIVLEFPQESRPIPEALEFLRAVVETRRRLRAIGMLEPQPPVLIHSENARRIYELGYAPSLSAFRPKGTGTLLGIKVLWDVDMDHYATTS